MYHYIYYHYSNKNLYILTFSRGIETQLIEAKGMNLFKLFKETDLLLCFGREKHACSSTVQHVHRLRVLRPFRSQ